MDEASDEEEPVGLRSLDATEKASARVCSTFPPIMFSLIEFLSSDIVDDATWICLPTYSSELFLSMIAGG
jgi:hypothetical protein